MSQQRKNHNSIAMKKKKIIDNRLLEISILVEDYIYENKPIMRHEAEMYAKEVTSYTDKCLGDERSLQVIEKLRRHMRGIIAEQGEPIDEEIFAQPLPGTTPRYQLLEEDIEVEDITQEFNSSRCLKEPVETGSKKIKAIIKRNIRDSSELDHDLTQCTQNTAIEDLTEFNNSTNCVKPIKKYRNKRKYEKITQDYNFQELNGLNSVEKPNTRAENKRNIIVEQNVKVKRNVSVNNISYLDVIDLCDDNDEVTECINSKNIGEKRQDLSSLNNLDNEVPNAPAILSPSILTSFDALQGTPKTNKQVSAKPSPGENVIDTENTVNKTNTITKTLINENIEGKSDKYITEEGNTFPKKDNAKRNQINKLIYAQINNINKLKNTINTQKTSVNPVEISKNKLDGATYANSKENKLKKLSVYSDKVINDLSWIENIRFVREIAKEEYEQVSIPDIFWDNYMLPENWNDDDFLYT